MRATEDSDLLARIVGAGIALEVCPTSNVQLGVYSSPDEVPLRRLSDAGAQVALSADDPLLFLSRLTDQYQIARDQGFSDAELAGFAKFHYGLDGNDRVEAKVASRGRRVADATRSRPRKGSA